MMTPPTRIPRVKYKSLAKLARVSCPMNFAINQKQRQGRTPELLNRAPTEAVLRQPPKDICFTAMDSGTSNVPLPEDTITSSLPITESVAVTGVVNSLPTLLSIAMKLGRSNYNF
ncbi:hypothetical protein Fot_12303 [Forsythia ovata]|uniref:Uncharacterized protein n=1 Tax=Forsythia ovata TaxID=205694 RepID=A0ABD1WQ15_9LAMI